MFEESYAISEKTGNAECIAQALCGLGITTSHKGDRKKAIVYFSRAADIFEKSGKMKDYAQQLVSMAGLQGAAGYYHVSESNYLKAEKIMLAQNDQYSLSVLYNNIADLYIQQKKLKKAVKYLEQAYACSKGYTDVNYNRLIVKNLSSIYETLGDSKRALKYRKLYEELNDEMINVAENVKYVGLNHAFEIHKKEKQLVQKDLQIKEMKTSGKLNYMLIAILCLSVFVVLFLYRRRIRRQLTLEENISSIARQISSLKLENSDLRVRLIQTESELHALESRYQGIKEELPTGLTALSKREYEVLLFVAEGLSDKEIAEKIFVSITTVRTHIRRIYDKLLVNNRIEATALLNKYQLLADYQTAG